MDNNLKANCTELTKSYNFYYHAPENNDYSLESYNEILSFNSLEEFWILDKFVRKDMIENGMFFIMADPILPIWEDKNNINGGCISWKVDRKNSYKYWIDSVGHFLTQNLGKHTTKVNGVSISPKKNSSIIKLWFSEEIDIENMNLPSSFVLANDKIIYKSHVQNIDKDKSKRAGTYTPYENEFLNNSNTHTPIIKVRQLKT
jgi:hypothetical protein